MLEGEPSMVNSKGDWSLDKSLRLLMEEFMVFGRNKKKMSRMLWYRFSCDCQNLGVFGNLKEYMFLVATLWKVLPQVLIELLPQSVCFALKSPPEMNFLPNYRKYDCMLCSEMELSGGQYVEVIINDM